MSSSYASSKFAVLVEYPWSTCRDRFRHTVTFNQTEINTSLTQSGRFLVLTCTILGNLNTGHVLDTHCFVFKTGKLNNFPAYANKGNIFLITSFLYMALGQSEWDGQMGGRIGPVYIYYGSQTEQDKTPIQTCEKSSMSG